MHFLVKIKYICKPHNDEDNGVVMTESKSCRRRVGEKSQKRQIASMMPDGQEMCEKCTYIIWQKNSSDTCCCKLGVRSEK